MVGENRPPPTSGPPSPNLLEAFPPLSLRDLPVGGRLGHFSDRWAEITKDSWVLSVVRTGYMLPFDSNPPLSPSPLFLGQNESPALEEEVHKLLLKGAVERVFPEDPGFYSRIFLVPKKNGKLRLIIDLSKLNAFLNVQSFSMETAIKVRNAILLNDWTFSLDLTDAYLHVPIHVKSRKYLRFTLKGQIFQFRALPFGLATSPFVFTRLMLAIATFLRLRAIVLFPYLDDWLVRNQCRHQLIKDKIFTVNLISSLGLLINYEKSDLVPSQNFVFIGMEFRTSENVVRIPWDRAQDILLLISWFQNQKKVTARMFLSLLGKLSAAAQFITLGRLHLRPLQMALFSQWKPHSLPLEHQIAISDAMIFHLNWWKNKERFIQGVPLKRPQVSHTVYVDASTRGWGAHVETQGFLCHGVWSPDQSLLHINILEMKAVFLALKHFQNVLVNSTFMIASDNSSVVAYIQKEGGTHSPSLCMEVWETLLWCHSHRITLRVRHIPGKTNILADRLSRMSKAISTEWSLKQSICNALFRVTGYPNIDLFATRLNNRLPLYVSPIPDSRALSVDALSMNWDRIHAYAFPPFHIIPKVLSKVRSHQCRIVLIAPFWPQASWYPELLQLVVQKPITLPLVPDLLSQLNGRIYHQNPQMLSLHAWTLSSSQSEIDNFHKELPIMSPELEEFPLGKSMMQNGKSLPLGAVEGKFLLSRPLL